MNLSDESAANATNGKHPPGPPGAAEPADARSRNRAAPGFFGRQGLKAIISPDLSR